MEKNTIVACNVCGRQYNNWAGSTPCCGSIAYVIDDNGNKTKDFMMYGSVNGGPIEELKITNK